MKFKIVLLFGVLLISVNQLFAQCATPTVTAVPGIICSGGTSSVNASAAGDSINWYTVSVGGSPIGTIGSGADFTVSPITTMTYYAESFVSTSSGTVTFNYTGGPQSYTVPAGVNTLSVDLSGARGGSSKGVFSAGGLGGRVTGTITVMPGQVLQIFVGGMGWFGSSVMNAPGGYNGGGKGGYNVTNATDGGGGGGGGSDIRISPYTLVDRVAVAGGGGGSGAWYAGDWGGKGGGLTGEHGWGNAINLGTGAGTGGDQCCFGIGGSFPMYCVGYNGSFGNGGNSGPCYNTGGGGGGGYYGGGSGINAGGGGGSSFLANGSHTQGVQNGDGVVIISYSATPCTSAPRVPITVTVNPNPPVTAVTSATNFICVGQTATLTAGGASTYVWNTTATTAVIVISPTVTTNYTVVGTDSLGCQASTIISQSVSLCASVDNLVSSSSVGILVYPNPSNSVLSIEVASIKENSTLELFNAIGEKIMNQKLTQEKAILNIEKFSTGIYFLKIDTKIIKFIRE